MTVHVLRVVFDFRLPRLLERSGAACPMRFVWFVCTAYVINIMGLTCFRAVIVAATCQDTTRSTPK
jgi:hypothetical protein